MKFNYFCILLIFCHVLIVNCGILDFISLDDEDDAPQKRDRENDCVCLKGNADGHNCVCCLDFQFTETFRFDPACVKIKYVSQSEVHMNITMGKTISRAATISTEKPNESVCLSMLGGFAKMCSKFNGLVPSSNNGLVGCLTMQPKLFGEVPVSFDFPCFDLNESEIRMIESPKKNEEDEEKEEAVEAEASEPSDDDETIGGIKVGDILNVVSKTADQGIKIITEFLGINEDEKKPEAAVESKTSPETKNNKNETKKS